MARGTDESEGSMNVEWWILVCGLLVIALVITLRFAGTVFARIVYGRVEGGRK